MTPSKAQYDAAFARERAIEYPSIDMFEATTGFAVDRDRLLAAARVLACPVKVNPPNWQHGRVLYALLRRKLSYDTRPGVVLDIGTAKGFSACVMTWAVEESGERHKVISVDIVEPSSRCARNSVLESEGGLLTVDEFVSPFISKRVDYEFRGQGSARLLVELYASNTRVCFAFVDGKHNSQAVAYECGMLADLQLPGDIAVFDDMQIPGVADGVRRGATGLYDIAHLDTGCSRRYAIGVRR